MWLVTPSETVTLLRAGMQMEAVCGMAHDLINTVVVLIVYHAKVTNVVLMIILL